MRNLAHLYTLQARHAEAVPLFEEALTVLHRAFGAQHEHTMRVARWLVSPCSVSIRLISMHHTHTRTHSELAEARRHVCSNCSSVRAVRLFILNSQNIAFFSWLEVLL